jgi:T5orf172 domain
MAATPSTFESNEVKESSHSNPYHRPVSMPSRNSNINPAIETRPRWLAHALNVRRNKIQKSHNLQTYISSGWVYVLSNSAMPGLIKVGYTKSSPEERARQLDTTGIPASFIVETAFLFADRAILVEKYSHEILSEHRKRDSREFFECSAKFAAEKIIEAARELSEKVLKIQPQLLTDDEKNAIKLRAEKLIQEQRDRELARAEQSRILQEQRNIEAEENRRQDELKKKNIDDEKRFKMGQLKMSKMRNAKIRGIILCVLTFGFVVMSDISLFLLFGALLSGIGVWRELREYDKWEDRL